MPAIRPQLSRREHLLTVAFATWLIIGLFVDGWAHNAGEPESFFTPWHGLFYSGFALTATWMSWVVWRGLGPGAGLRSAVPAGYGLGLLGVAVFALGGVGDLVWHQLFGVEVDLEALLSPSHLVLFVGGLLILSSPLRAAWSGPTGRSPSFAQLLPALLSATLVTALVAFFSMDFSPWLTGAATAGPYRLIPTVVPDADIAAWMVEEVQLGGFAAILLTTVILMTPTLLLLRRWALPFGSLTLLFGAVATLSSSIDGFDQAATLAGPIVAGVLADVLVRRLRPSPERPGAMRTFAAAVPAALWLTHFALLWVTASVGWSVELWAGITGVSALTGLGLSLLAAPPVVPLTVDDEPAIETSPVAAHDRAPVPA